MELKDLLLQGMTKDAILQEMEKQLNIAEAEIEADKKAALPGILAEERNKLATSIIRYAIAAGFIKENKEQFDNWQLIIECFLQSIEDIYGQR